WYAAIARGRRYIAEPATRNKQPPVTCLSRTPSTLRAVVRHAPRGAYSLEGKSMKLWWNVAMPALVAGVMAAGAPTQASAQGAIKMDGSSTVFPIAEALAEEYQISKRGKVRVTVGIAGTGGGFKKFCRGEPDMPNASRPILKEEMEACRAAGIKYLEIPVAFDALTVVVNPQNTWVKSMTVADLKKMW